MANVITGQDIEQLMSQFKKEEVSEIKMFAGNENDKKPLISKGFKLIHPDSGLIYTVKSLVKTNGEYFLNCERGDGTPVKISEKDLESYTRL
jgi:hypothetical protein